MRALLRQMRPDNFEDISAVIALYRPGPMGMNSHTNYALRKNGLQAITPIHPELDEPLAEILGDTYGLIVYQEQVQKAAQKVAGYSLGQADLLRRAMGKKKKEILDKEFVPFETGMTRARLLRRPRSRPCGTSWSRSPATPSTRRTRPPTAWSRTGRPTSRPTTRPSTWPACSPRSATTRTSPRSTWPSAAHGDHGAAAGRQRVGRRCSPPVGDDIRFGLAAVRNVGANVVDAIVARPRGQGRVHVLHRLPRQGPGGRLQQADHRVADQGRRVRLARAPAPGPAAGARAGGRLGDRHQAQGGERAVRPVRRLRGRRRRRRTGVRRRRSRTCRSGTRSSGSPSSARCSGCTSPTTRCPGLEHVLSAAADVLDRHAPRRRGAP